MADPPPPLPQPLEPLLDQRAARILFHRCRVLALAVGYRFDQSGVTLTAEDGTETFHAWPVAKRATRLGLLDDPPRPLP